MADLMFPSKQESAKEQQQDTANELTNGKPIEIIAVQERHSISLSVSVRQQQQQLVGLARAAARMRTAALLFALALTASQQVASASYWVDTHATSKGNSYWSGNTPKPVNSISKQALTPKPATSNHNSDYNQWKTGKTPCTFSPSGWGGYVPGSLVPPNIVVTPKPNAPMPAVQTKAPVVPTSKPSIAPTTSTPPTETPTTSKPPKPTKTPKAPKPTKTPKPTNASQNDGDDDDTEGSNDTNDTEGSNDTDETDAPATPAPTPKPKSPPAQQLTPTSTPAVTAAPANVTVAPSATSPKSTVVPATPTPTLATLSPTIAPTMTPALTMSPPTVAPTPVPTTLTPTLVPTTVTPTPEPTTVTPTLEPTPEPATLAPTSTPDVATPAPVPAPTLPTSNWPVAADVVHLAAPQVIAAGEVFDGGMKKYERTNVVCDEAKEPVSSDAVFIVHAGGTLKNAIIGGNQVAGVFCADNKCALDNVWSEDVCQAALVVATGAGTTTVTGGGAKAASSRVIFAKSAGTVTVSGGFYMDSCAALFESCTTCGPVKRQVIVDGVVSVNPTAELVRVNRNYKDEAVIASAKIVTPTVDYKICTHYDGGKAPSLVGSGVDGTLCQYTTSSVSIVSL